MGNVIAANKPPTADTADSLYANSPSPTQADKKAKVDILNPGNLAEIHKSTQEIFPRTFDGARIFFYNRLSNYFHVHHSIGLSKQAGSYRYGATYNVATRTPVIDHTRQVRPMLNGEMDASGNLSANLYHRIGNKLGLEFNATMANRQISFAELLATFRGDRYTTSVSILNPNLLNNFEGLFVVQHLHNFTKQLALGADITCKRANRIVGGQQVAASFSGRYTDEDFVASGTVGATRLHLCYYQRASEQLHLGVELQTNFGLGESAAKIGYHVCMAEPDIQFRGSIDTNMNAAAVFEKRLNPIPLTLMLSGNLNHKNNVFRLGLGVIVDIK